LARRNAAALSSMFSAFRRLRTTIERARAKARPGDLPPAARLSGPATASSQRHLRLLP
jgi:hypothetical protein